MNLAKFLAEREEVTKVVFVRRAIRTFMEETVETRKGYI